MDDLCHYKPEKPHYKNNADDGKDGVHEVTIEVDKNEPSRQSVAFRLQNPDAELSSPKYRGTKFWPSQILLIGDLVL